MDKLDDGELVMSLENLNECNLNDKIKNCSIIFWDPEPEYYTYNNKDTLSPKFFVGVPYTGTLDNLVCD